MLRFTVATFGIVALLLMGAVVGGLWIWAALLYITVFAYAIDRLSPYVMANADPESEFPASDTLSAALAVAHFVVLVVVVFTLVQSAQHSTLEKIVLLFATSLFAGQIGHPNAHELIHRSARPLRRLGKAIYMSILMGHQASAHPLVHHVHVGTSKDPVSAPKGRGFWRFFGRAWIGSFRAGYAAENKRRKGQGFHPYVMVSTWRCSVLACSLRAWRCQRGTDLGIDRALCAASDLSKRLCPALRAAPQNVGK